MNLKCSKRFLKLDTLDAKVLVSHTKSEKNKKTTVSFLKAPAKSCHQMLLYAVVTSSWSKFFQFCAALCCLAIKQHKDRIKLQVFGDLQTELVDRSLFREDPGTMRLISEAKKVKGLVDEMLIRDYHVVANHLPDALSSAPVLASCQPASGFLF